MSRFIRGLRDRLLRRRPAPPVPVEQPTGPMTEDGRLWDDLSPEEKDHLNHTVWDMRAWSADTANDRNFKT